MYSEELQDVFEDHNISLGDRIRITHNETAREGTLMPQTAQGDTNTVVIKLDNGYNLGITYRDDTTIDLVQHHEPTPAEPATTPEYDPDKPGITILHTGGTIASRVSYEEGGVKPAFEPEELLEIYPELGETANINSAVIAQMFSEDMEPGHWVKIAEAVAEHRDADGIIVGHGTDTMQYTAAALSFMLENIDVPVVLVGSQRSSDRPSSDAAMNLMAAVEFIQDGHPGVYVCMHDSMSDATAAIHAGTRVRKMHTSRRDAFKSIDASPIAHIDHDTGEITYEDKDRLPETDGEFRLRTELDTNVGLLKTTPGLDADLLTYYTEQDYHGIVVEGTGLGHLPVNAFDEETSHHDELLENVAHFTENGLMAMSSQCINGRVNMNVYESGVKLQRAGVISAQTMTPEAAYVKLMWSLGQTDTIKDAKQLFTTNIAGELLTREQYDAY